MKQINLGYVPDFADIPRTDKNFVKEECQDTLQYGRSYANKKKMKVYQTKQVQGFVRLSNNDGCFSTEEIFRFKDNKLQDGGFKRMKFSSGTTCFGFKIFSKSPDDGEEIREYCLLRFGRNIEYWEKILGIRETYTFNPDKLEWNKKRRSNVTIDEDDSI